MSVDQLRDKFELFREQWQPKVIAEMDKPFVEREVKLMLIEPRGVPNTGDQGGERTARNDVWV